MRYVELFAGVGGFRLGIERAYRNWGDAEKRRKNKGSSTSSNVRSRRGERNQATCVYSNEWDKHAAETYKKHFGEIDTRDITTVQPSEIPKHDLICGGFPCQAFSVAGKRRGFEETRGTLFFEICRIARHHRTPYLFLENVKGLLNHDGGKTFQTILGSLDELGYDVQWQVLNSKDFGVPQNRERVFIIGHLRGRPRPEVFPITESGKKDIGSRKEGVSTTLRTRDADRDGGTFVMQQVKVRSANRGGVEIANAGDSINYSQPKSKTRRGRVGKKVAQTLDTGVQQGVVQRTPLRFKGRNQKNISGDYAFTVDAGHTGGVKVGTAIRRLTPIECERLQGFPDGWTQGQSDTQRYKQMGNAVTVNVIEVIARKLLPCI